MSINDLNYFIHGLKIKSYEFNLYKSQKKKNLFLVEVFINRSKIDITNIKKLNSIETGVNFARDLVSEPPNILFPKEYVNRLIKLKKLELRLQSIMKLK